MASYVIKRFSNFPMELPEQFGLPHKWFLFIGSFNFFAKKVPGLLVQYETTLGNTAVIFKLKELNYNPVQVALFDVPEDGYRIIEWEQIEKSKGN